MWAAAAVLCAALACSIGPASAESLNDTLVAAYNYNPRLDAERARLRATDEDVARAMSGFRPSVTANGDTSYQHLESRPNSTNDGTTHPKGYSIDVVQPLFQGFQTLYDVRQSEANVRAGRETLRNVEQIVMVDAVTAFMDVIRDQEIVKLRENNVAALSKELKADQDRFAVGEVTKTDVAQAQARRAGAVSALDAARANLKISRANFEKTVGHPPAALIDPSQNVPNLPKTLDEAIAVGTKENPNVVAALYREEAARHDVDKIRGELLPQAQLEASFIDRFEPSRFFDETETARVTGRVSVPIYEGGEVYARVRQAKHIHVSRLQEIEQTRTEVQQAVTQAWSQLLAARAQQDSDKIQVEANATALDGVREEEKVGQRTVSDVLDAQLEFHNAQVQLATTRRNVIVSAYNVLSSVGRLDGLNIGAAGTVYDPEAHYEEVRRQWFGLSITHEDGHRENIDVWPAEVQHAPAK